ncbi:MAG TPA: hypothetical protein PLW70_06765 [Bacteroidales bacterium]|nr:hypothetical protein [Bacteroidales bacterium]
MNNIFNNVSATRDNRAAARYTALSPGTLFLCVNTLSLLMASFQICRRPQHLCHSLTLPSNSACTRTCMLPVVIYARHT